ncbi:MAG: hypothetical protein QM791_17890 [Ferruginibacter sp.]
MTWLFVGIFRDSEFYEPSIFTKYRPTFKVFFYTPIGESDLEMEELSTSKQSEEIAFQEFVIKQHQQYNSDSKLWYLPFILIQLTLTFLCFGIFKNWTNLTYKNWQLAVHFLINIIITTAGLAFLLSFDKTIITMLIIVIILAANCWAIILLTKRRLRITT